METMGSHFYLKNASGELVRTLHWTTDTLFLIYNQKSRRVEARTTTSDLDAKQVPYQVLDIVSQNMFLKSNQINISKTNLRLVKGAYPTFKTSFSLPKDDFRLFLATLQKTIIAGCSAVFLFVMLEYLFPKQIEQKPELQIVQVIDRHNDSKIVTPTESRAKNKSVLAISKKRITNVTRLLPQKSRKVASKELPSGREVGILGTLTASAKTGGLQLNQIGANRGIGHGGKSGSGGIQTSVYSQGIFSAPLGQGQKAQGTGGYGTKGKGGGNASYGKQSLVGVSSGYFQPIAGETLVEGGLDPNEIASVIQRHESEIRACYEKALQSQPTLKGRLSMKFLIGARGQVTTASISNSSLNHPGVETCIQARLRSWPFPQPQGGVTVKVNYPFVLKRVSGT